MGSEVLPVERGCRKGDVKGYREHRGRTGGLGPVGQPKCPVWALSAGNPDSCTPSHPDSVRVGHFKMKERERAAG